MCNCKKRNVHKPSENEMILNKYGMIPQNYNRSTNVAMEHNVMRLCVCLPLAQGFKFTTNVDGANSTKPLVSGSCRIIKTKF